MDERLSKSFVRLVVLTGLLLLLSFTGAHAATQQTPFTKNMGQWPDSILFRTEANGATLWLTKNGIWYQFSRILSNTDTKGAESQPQAEIAMVKAEFVGANGAAEVVGLGEMTYTCNYFMGRNPANWHTDVPNYYSVTMRNIVSGVDITFSVNKGHLRQEQHTSSRDKQSQIQIAYHTKAGVTTGTDSITTVHTTFGEYHFSGVTLVDQASSETEQHPLSGVADASDLLPGFSWTSGGNGADEARGIAVDGGGNSFITGWTCSMNFPVQDGSDSTYNGGPFDAFVVKLNSAGILIYSAYIGGNGNDRGNGIAIESGSHAYITGYTSSTDFPLVSAVDSSLDGATDMFIARVSSSGNILSFATYFGGSADDYGEAITVDNPGNMYITGKTASSDLFTHNAYDPTFHGGTYDAFICKFNSLRTNLWSTYFGGSGMDVGEGIALDMAGNIYLTGQTNSTDFPLASAFDGTFNGGSTDAFVCKLNNAGSILAYSTYLGGSGDEVGRGIGVDTTGDAIVTGFTASTDFFTHHSLDSSLGGSSDAFVSKFNADGSINWSTYLGGSGPDTGNGIKVVGAENVYVTGSTASADFPLLAAFDNTLNGGSDAFITKLDNVSNTVVYTTYLGGDSLDAAFGVGADRWGNPYITGYTTSSGASNAFVSKLLFDADADGIDDEYDNCPNVANPDQADADGDRIGDVCDDCMDTDGDGFGDPGFPTNTCTVDNCPTIANPTQADADGDGIGDVCDVCTDTDGDGLGDPGFPANTCAVDNCPTIANANQADADGDSIGDACDVCTDTDGDGFGDPGFPANTCTIDNCPSIANPTQADADSDGIGDVCDVCTDTDGDGFGDPGFPANTCAVDNCPTIANPTQADADGDGIGDVCDLCTDTDGDGFGDPGFPANTCALDNCPTIANANQEDADGDSIGDVCDICTDTDGDGFGDPGFPANTCTIDNCPSIANPLQADADADGIGDTCDLCTDIDGDGFGDPGYPANTCAVDNCPMTANANQADADGDSIGDVCDNCPAIANPTQADSDHDNIGDACESCCAPPIRGNVNGAGGVTVTDLTFLVSFLFNSGPTPPCLDEANVNGIGNITVTDLTALVAFLFNGGASPAACP